MKKLLAVICVIFAFSACFFVGCNEDTKITIKIETYNETTINDIIVDSKDSIDEILTNISVLSYENHEIEGLYFDEAFTEKWNETDLIKKDATLYVKWVGIEYSVNFVGGEGTTGEMSPQKIRFDDSNALSQNNFKKDGYTFLGWSTNENSTTADFCDCYQYTMSTQGVTLYAVWIGNLANISLKGNGGVVGAKDTITINSRYNEEVSLSANTFTKTGYTFAGWNTKADGTGISYADKAKVQVSSTSGITLFAQWTANNYNIVFDNNTGSGEMSSQSVAYDSSVNINANTFTKTGYTFAGWNTKADGTGTAYVDQAQITMNSVDGITLYAQWTVNSYNIVFDNNTGSGSMTNQSVAYESSANLNANTFTKTGYKFAGWNTKADGEGTSYANQAEITMDSVDGITLYAQWTANNYNIVFNGNTGNGAMTNQAVAYDSSVNLNANTFTKTGYTFAGWNTKADGTGTSYANQAQITMKSIDGITLYAQWTANNYDIVFNGNTGSGAMTNQAVAYDGSANLNANTFTKTGYKFAGWNTKADGEGTSYANQAEITMDSVDGITLYAQWTANNYNIVFNNNTGSGAMTNQAVAYETSANLNTNTFTKTGYTFAGWNTEADGEGTAYADQAEITMNSVDGITLYAQWTANNYNIVFDNNTGSGEMTNQSVAYDSSVNLYANTFTKTGYKFVGWNTKADGEGTAYADQAQITMDSVDGITLYAQWVANDFNLVFNGNTGSDAMTNQAVAYESSANLNANTFTKTGYTFAGWNTKADGTGTAYADQAQITMDSVDGITLYAQWTANNYNIVFDNNTGSGEMTNQSVAYDSSVNLNANTFTKTGYTFAGWNTEADGGGTAYADQAQITMDSVDGITLYAQWTANNYNVVFDNNTGSGEMTNQAVAYDGSANLNTNTFTKTGYTFAGWNTKADGTGTSYANQAQITMDSVDGITLYAQWTVNSYNIVFDNNTGSGEMSNQSVAYESSVNLNANTFTKTGYTFAGWNTKADGTGTTFVDQAQITMNSVDGITLYAQWTANTYDLKYDANTGIGNMDSASILYDSNITLPLNTFTKTGYTFAGWNTKADGTGRTYADQAQLTMDSIDGITLYAQWTATEYEITYNLDDGKNSNNNSGKYTIESEDITLDPATKDNYTFVGWFSSSDTQNSSTLVTEITKGHTGNITLYAKFVETASFKYTFDGNGASIGTSFGSKEINYSFSDDAIIIDKTMSLSGYTFEGWELASDAYIGYNLVSAGTLLPRNDNNKQFIGAHSWGEIKLRARWTIQQHTVTFKQYDGENWIQVGDVITGDYCSSLTNISSYSDNVATYNADMAKNGYAFDGWFTSSSDFSESKKFDFKISYNDINVYAHYIAVLSAPTGLSQNKIDEKDTGIFEWDVVTSDAKVTVKYEVYVDDDLKLTTEGTTADLRLVMATAKTYKVSVKAISDYEGYLGESINATTTATLESEYVNIAEVTKMKGVKDNSNHNVVLMFTNNIYEFTSPAFDIVLKTLDGNELTDTELAQVSKNEDLKTVTIGSKIGNFILKTDYANDEDDAEYVVQVVYDALNFTTGEGYQSYLESVDAETSDYRSVTNPVTTSLGYNTVAPFYVGTANPVDFGYVISKTNTNGITEFDDYDFSTITVENGSEEEVVNLDLVTISYKIYENSAWRDATGNEIPTISKSSTGRNLFKFDDSNVGKKYKLTISLKYTTVVSNLSISYEFTLNDGYNVHDTLELRARYGDINVKTINIIGKIVSVLQEDQTQADGSPINTQRSNIFANSDTTSSNNTTGEGGRKTDGNVYKRAYDDGSDASITVNGNYQTIDASAIPVVNAEYSSGVGTNNDGVNNQTGYQSQTYSDSNFILLRPHCGVFYFRGNGTATFNNLTIQGNKALGNIKEEVSSSDATAWEAFRAKATADSGSLSGFYVETSNVVLNAVNINNTHHAVRMDGCAKNYAYNGDGSKATTYARNNAITSCTDCQVENTYAAGLYSWEGKNFALYNCYLTECNGPAVQMDCASTNTCPIFSMDKFTTINNYVTGSESWFTLWGQGGMAQDLKASLQPVLVDDSKGLSILKSFAVDNETTVEATNFVFVYRPGTNINEGTYYDDEGNQITNRSLNSKCTTYIGGEKSSTLESDDHAGRVFAITTGTKTERSGSALWNSGDSRLVSASQMTFPITKFSSTTDFTTACNMVGALLSINAGSMATAPYNLDLLSLYANAEDQSVIAMATSINSQLTTAEAIRAYIKNTIMNTVVSNPYTFEQAFSTVYSDEVLLKVAQLYAKYKTKYDGYLASSGINTAVTHIMMHMGIECLNGSQMFEIVNQEGQGTQIVYIEYGYVDDATNTWKK